MSEKVFRDPVHSLMRFDTEEERIVLDLIETRELQRLKYIKQLGVSYVVYPGAVHTRFSHSLATAYLMKRVIERFKLKGYKVILTCAALLHDIGHLPFSHLLEEFTKEGHEVRTAAIITDKKSEVREVLKSYDPSYPNQIRQILERTFKPSFAVKLISSQLDVDRMDYLLRDSFYTGVGYGNFDLDWLIHSLRVVEVDGDWEVAVDLHKGVRAAEGYVLARYYMYRQVYHHKRGRAAGAMIKKILQRAGDLLKEGHQIFVIGPLKRLLMNSHLSFEDFLSLDDVVLSFAIRQWERSKDPILADLCLRFNRGKIFEVIDLGDPDPEILEKVKKAALSHGLDPLYYVELDRAADNPYIDDYLVYDDKKKKKMKAGENIFLSDGKNLIELSSHSELIGAIRNRTFVTDRLCFPGEIKGDVAKFLA
jgi:hypothetical protein